MSGELAALTKRLKAKRDLAGVAGVGVWDRTAVGREDAAEVKEVLPWPPQPETKRKSASLVVCWSFGGLSFA